MRSIGPADDTDRDGKMKEDHRRPTTCVSCSLASSPATASSRRSWKFSEFCLEFVPHAEASRPASAQAAARDDVSRQAAVARALPARPTPANGRRITATPPTVPAESIRLHVGLRGGGDGRGPAAATLRRVAGEAAACLAGLAREVLGGAAESRAHHWLTAPRPRSVRCDMEAWAARGPGSAVTMRPAAGWHSTRRSRPQRLLRTHMGRYDGDAIAEDLARAEWLRTVRRLERLVSASEATPPAELVGSPHVPRRLRQSRRPARDHPPRQLGHRLACWLKRLTLGPCSILGDREAVATAMTVDFASLQELHLADNEIGDVGVVLLESPSGSPAAVDAVVDWYGGGGTACVAAPIAGG